jgi:hypothetical protein
MIHLRTFFKIKNVLIFNSTIRCSQVKCCNDTESFFLEKLFLVIFSEIEKNCVRKRIVSHVAVEFTFKKLCIENAIKFLEPDFFALLLQLQSVLMIFVTCKELRMALKRKLKKMKCDTRALEASCGAC